MERVFLLSPAKVNGVRAKILLNRFAPFPLAQKFHRSGLSLAEVFTFASGLYFRGKITYARRFAIGSNLIRIITTNAGLLPSDYPVTARSLRAFGRLEIHEGNPRFRAPLLRDALEIARNLGTDGRAILLGSIATAKYRDVLIEAFGRRLVFPCDFVGRGDMSRGGLLLRAARDGTELKYIPVEGAAFKGRRAPRIADMQRSPTD